ncbi:hypothetical protein BGW80DRAFT_1252335 [Lactifluus volemus]|nr:hypothetical protein BGW80DRAFT_1252335 [Lactifluus volemus]
MPLFNPFYLRQIWLFRIPSRSNSSTEIDGRILYQLFNYLVVEDSDWMNSLKYPWLLQIINNSEKIRRLVVCVNFSDVLRLPDVASSILRDIFPPDLHNAVEIGQFLRNQANRGQTKVGLCAQSIVAGIISKVQGSNERWVSLAADQLGKSEDVIRGYLEDGNDDNMLLANLTHITREIFHSLKENRDMAASSASILPSLSNFDIRNTLPELQNSFLALWNEIEQAPNDSVPTEIRDHLLNLHNALNQGTDDPVTTPSVSQTNTIIGTSLPVSYHGVTADAADELSPGGIPEAARRPTTPSRPTPALVSFGHSGTSHADASAAADAAITGNIANTQFGEQPTIRPDSSSVLPAMVTSTPSTTPEVASIFRPADAAPLISHHDAQDLGGPIEMTSLHRTRQSGTPAQNLDASDSPI